MISFLIKLVEVERLVRLERALKARHPGSRITRADAARAAVNVGLDALEREMRIVAPPGGRRSAARG